MRKINYSERVKTIFHFIYSQGIGHEITEKQFFDCFKDLKVNELFLLCKEFKEFGFSKDLAHLMLINLPKDLINRINDAIFINSQRLFIRLLFKLKICKIKRNEKAI